mgnify:CR=1 FL=1
MKRQVNPFRFLFDPVARASRGSNRLFNLFTKTVKRLSKQNAIIDSDTARNTITINHLVEENAQLDNIKAKNAKMIQKIEEFLA